MIELKRFVNWRGHSEVQLVGGVKRRQDLCRELGSKSFVDLRFWCPIYFLQNFNHNGLFYQDFIVIFLGYCLGLMSRLYWIGLRSDKAALFAIANIWWGNKYGGILISSTRITRYRWITTNKRHDHSKIQVVGEIFKGGINVSLVDCWFLLRWLIDMKIPRNLWFPLL